MDQDKIVNAVISSTEFKVFLSSQIDAQIRGGKPAKTEKAISKKKIEKAIKK